MTTIGASRPATSSGRRTNPWAHLDLALLGTTVAIAATGVLMVYSSTFARLAESGGDPTSFLKRQGAFAVVGLGLMAGATVVDYRVFRDFAAHIYVGTMAVLLLILSPLGNEAKGQQASFRLGGFQLQPSEFAKVVLIVALSAYLSQRRGELDLKALGTALAIAAVPMGLICLQPDLGTAMVFGAIILAMLAVGGARPRHLAALAGMGVVAIIAVIKLGALKQYQLDRLGAFLDPTGDTQRSAYNLDQSKTAIGSGGLFGKGLFEGTQTNLSYVPEQHTDFIFTAVGEQLGLLGSGALLLAFGFLVWRVWRAAALARDLSGTLICAGVLGMLVFQIFENVGMTMGIMPITGIPLPLMSYGGSSLLATFIAIGLVLNVHMRRFS